MLPLLPEVLRCTAPGYEERGRVFAESPELAYEAFDRFALFPFVSEASFVVAGQRIGNDLLIVTQGEPGQQLDAARVGGVLAPGRAPLFSSDCECATPRRASAESGSLASAPMPPDGAKGWPRRTARRRPG
jgi:hypothetical protein